MRFDPSDLASTGSLFFFRKKFPYYANNNQPYRKDTKKMKLYGRLSSVVLVCVMFYFFAGPLFLSALLSLFGNAIHTILTPAGVVFYPNEWIMYIITGLPLNLGLLLWLYEGTFKLFLQDTYSEFADYYNDLQGYDNHKAGLLFCRPFLILAILTLPFSFGSRLATSEETISIRRFYDISTHTYTYKDVNQIILYNKTINKQGVTSDAPHYIVEFTDGFTLNPELFLGTIDNATPFVNTILQKTGKNIVYRDIHY